MRFNHLKRREFITLLGGAMAAWPLMARAQQPLPAIGFLHQGFRDPPSLINAFKKGLSEVGIIEGQSVTIEDRAADGHYDRLPALAAELVGHPVAVIAANFLPAALAAKAATQTIPIVFLSGSDPIQSGLVSSINRPTGNVTGIAPMFTLLETKNLELLHELVPGATVVGALANLTNPNAEHQSRDLQTAARILGLELIILPGSNEREIDSSFATMAERQIGALVVSADGFLISRQDQIVELAAHYAVPTMYPLSQYIEAGGLMSYGANLRDAFLQTGVYVGRILKGTKPADLPVLQPTKLEFVINLKTAKALGLDVPPKLLALADETIE
jgi:putative tryptophan/tyrosine transport system substrate-binding protein